MKRDNKSLLCGEYWKEAMWFYNRVRPQTHLMDGWLAVKIILYLR